MGCSSKWLVLRPFLGSHSSILLRSQGSWKEVCILDRLPPAAAGRLQSAYKAQFAKKKLKNCRKRLKTRMKICHLIRFDAPLCKCSQAKDLCCVLGHCCCCWLLQAFHGQEPLFTNYALSGSQTEPFVATLDAQIN